MHFCNLILGPRYLWRECIFHYYMHTRSCHILVRQFFGRFIQVSESPGMIGSRCWCPYWGKQDTRSRAVLPRHWSQLYGNVQGLRAPSLVWDRCLVFVLVEIAKSYLQTWSLSIEILRTQISTQYSPHLVFLPTGMVISGCRLVCSILLTGIQVLFH